MAKMRIAKKDRAKVKLECLRMLFGLGLEEDKQEIVANFVDTYIELTKKEQVIFEKEREKLEPKEKEKFMVFENSWKREGRLEGKKEIALFWVEKKLGEVDPEIKNKVQKLSSRRLDALVSALIDFSTMQEFEQWIQDNAPKR
jgi:Domain of unknown function (DUF4351)